MGDLERSPDAVVIGAGVIGCSIALELGRAGYRVQVLDKGPAAGAGSTSSSSAVVRFNYSTLDAVVTAWESKHIWDKWGDLVGSGDESGLARFHKIGALLLDAPGRQRAERMVELFRKVGVSYEYLDSDELGRRYPGMDTGRYWPPRTVDDERFWDPADGRLEAWFTPEAGFIDDPQLAAHNLMIAAREKGARFFFNSEVTAVRRRDARVSGVELADGSVLSTGIVVNASGPFSSRVNLLAGVVADFAELSTRALRQEVHVLPGPEGSRFGDGGVVVMDADLGTYFRPQPGGTILVGGLEPDCDPMIWVDDPDELDPTPSVQAWEAQAYRVARRLPNVGVPSRPSGLAALYDVTPDWVPIYDCTSLRGFFVAIGTSGNQFKNAPMVGRFLRALIEACERGHNHDHDPVRVGCESTGNEVNLGHYSRLRSLADTTQSVLG